jgi:hypothetical protein
MVDNLSLNELKQRARTIGASREFVDRFRVDTDKKYLKSYIIQNSVSDEHIVTTDIIEDIVLQDNIKKRDYCRAQNRKHEEGVPIQCPVKSENLNDYENVILPSLRNKEKIEYKEQYQEHFNFLTPEELIIYMKQDIEDYEDKNISFMM